MTAVGAVKNTTAADPFLLFVILINGEGIICIIPIKHAFYESKDEN